MKTLKIIILAVVLVIASATAYQLVFKNLLEDRTISRVVQETVSRPDIPVAFSYPSGEAGMTLIEPPTVDGEMLNHAFILMRTEAYREYQTNDFAGEAPAAISLFMFNFPEQAEAENVEPIGRIARLQNWALDNQSLTSFDSVENTPDIVELDGVKALRYTAEGAFNQDIYLAAYSGNIYMFVGQYESVEDDIYTVFQELVASISF